MRIGLPSGDSRFRYRQRTELGFTLSEMLIAMTIFFLVVGGVIATNLFGLRMIELTEPKQQSAERARELVNQLSDDIGTGWKIQIGTGDLGSFVRVPRGSEKKGSSLKVWRDSQDTNDVVVYHLVSGELFRDDASSTKLVAWSVTNDEIFTGEDFSGTPLTEDRTSMVIGVSLQFSELERTGTPLGPDLTYKSYEFQSHLTWHAR